MHPVIPTAHSAIDPTKKDNSDQKHDSVKSGYLVFRLANENYLFASPTSQISAVIPVPSIDVPPNTRSWFLGVGRYQDAVMPVTDFSAWLIGADSDPADSDARVLVVRKDNFIFGLLAVSILGIKTYSRPGHAPHLGSLNGDRFSEAGVLLLTSEKRIEFGGKMYSVDALLALDLKRIVGLRSYLHVHNAWDG